MTSKNAFRRIPLPGFYEFGLGGITGFDAALLAKELGLKQVYVSSGDSLLTTAEDVAAMDKTGAVVKEMEAAAIAWVCRAMETPFFALKSITDHLDVPESEAAQFMANLRLASSNLASMLERLVVMLDEKPALWRLS